jgi:Raf kinase inhibitor-like YbhB/YbcL family protein
VAGGGSGGVAGTGASAGSAGSAASGGAGQDAAADVGPDVPGSWKLTSSAFAQGATIPTVHTCKGADESPPLAWTQPPAGTMSLALLCDDPDAPGGTFSHWVAWNIPVSMVSLPQAVPKTSTVLGGVLQGTNGFMKVGYGGPCPPPGAPHHYRFLLVALDVMPAIGAGATHKQLETAMTGHIVAQTELVGLFGQ